MCGLLNVCWSNSNQIASMMGRLIPHNYYSKLIHEVLRSREMQLRKENFRILYSPIQSMCILLSRVLCLIRDIRSVTSRCISDQIMVRITANPLGYASTVTQSTFWSTLSVSRSWVDFMSMSVCFHGAPCTTVENLS